MHHRVKEVSLIDATQAGKRTIVCFFLVDPTVRVRSTATVPPQQRAWMVTPETMASLKEAFSEIAASSIMSFVPYRMDYVMACERRERLMEERRANNFPVEDDEDSQRRRGPLVDMLPSFFTLRILAESKHRGFTWMGRIEMLCQTPFVHIVSTDR